MEPALFTIGHSTRPIEKFTEMLQGHQITMLVDVRTIPRSRHNPQFNKETLAEALKTAGVRYLHCKNLGGLRHAVKDSVNTGWRNKSFRGYADYMGTAAFSHALEEIIDYAQKGERVALMCAEGAPFRCHRSLIADAVVVRGLEICEISSATRATPHKLTPFARLEQGRITYPQS
jgi:uncharacterized protein (DUF488 family)